MTYTYECNNCHKQQTVEQRITDQPLDWCTSCQNYTLHRTISAAPDFALMGKGWAKDGYASKSVRGGWRA